MKPDKETQERILDAAQESFLLHGTSGARMQEIADQAEVNKALVHYYFRNKDQLAEAVFRRAFGRLLPTVLQTLMSEASLEDKIRAVVARYLDVLTRIPGLPAYLLAEMHYHPERLQQFIDSTVLGGRTSTLSTVFEVLRGQIDEEVARGRIKPIAPEQLLVNTIALCVFPFAARPLVTLMLGQGPEGFDAFNNVRRDTLADFVLGAMKP